MKTRILFAATVLVIIGVASVGILYYFFPSLIAPNGDDQNLQEFNFEQWFSNPTQYNGTEITIEGYYFNGFEINILSEKLVYSGNALGHLTPTGRMIWIEGNIPKEIYDSLYRQEMMGPTERYGQIRIKGKFECGGKYGHLGQYDYQIIPSEVWLLAWTPPQ